MGGLKNQGQETNGSTRPEESRNVTCINFAVTRADLEVMNIAMKIPFSVLNLHNS